MPNINLTWEPGSVIKLCRVPWDSNYDNVIAWAHNDGTDKVPLTSRDEYFDSLTDVTSITLTESAYCPIGVPVQVAVPFSTARNYNYLVVDNPQLPTDWDFSPDTPYKFPLRYFYFIVDCQQPNPGSSLLTLQLDVWTTYFPHSFELGTGYVERGHVALVNAPSLITGVDMPRAMNAYLSEPEGIDTGSEFQVVHEECVSLQSKYYYDEERHEGYYTDPEPDWVIIVSTADLSADPGTINAPSLVTASGAVVDGLLSGCNVYAVKLSDFGNIFTNLQKYSWVSQCVISLTVVPGTLYNSDELESVRMFGKTPDVLYKLPNRHSVFTISSYIDILDARDYGWDNDVIADEVKDAGYFDLTPYKNLRKLWTYPYSVFEVSGFGQSVFFKPQLFAVRREFLHYMYQSVSPFAQIAMFLNGYGTNRYHNFDYKSYTAAGMVSGSVGYGDFLDAAIWWDNFPQFSVTNNSYIAFMAGTAHTRDYQYNSAAWTLNSANLNAYTSFGNNALNLQLANENAQLDMQNQAANNALSNSSAMTSILASSATGALNSIGSFGSGNVIGGVTGLAGTVINTAANVSNLQNTVQIQNNNLGLQAAQLANSQSTGYAVADNNYALAKTIAQGNYDNQVAGIDAGYADAALKSPSSSGNVGGNGMRYSNGQFFNYQIKLKRISDGAIKRVGDYFLRFGYTIHRFMKIPTNMVYNEHYTYWKMQQLEITSAYMTETEKDAVRGIFSKGVTLWRKPDEIGTVLPVDNQPMESVVDTYYV